jgi:hypothetical protein
LIVGCPSEKETVLDGFIRRVSPDVVVVQDNRIPAYDRADGELLRRLRTMVKRVYAVSREGSIAIRCVGGTYSIDSISGLSR